MSSGTNTIERRTYGFYTRAEAKELLRTSDHGIGSLIEQHQIRVTRKSDAPNSPQLLNVVDVNAIIEAPPNMLRVTA